MSLSRLALIVALGCIAGCRPDPDPQPAPAPAEPSATPSVPLAGSPASDVAAAKATTGLTAAADDEGAPLPTAVQGASDLSDDFTGWYYERGGKALLQACGQPVPLEVSDPAFLRRLGAKLGGATAPVYVRLGVRPVAGSRIEVAEVRQFGVDEGPVADCPLVAGM